MTSIDPSDGFPAPAEDSQRSKRMGLRRKVSLKFKEFQGFVNEYSENVSTGGMFIRMPSPQPAGSVFDFEFTLGDDYTLIHGIGEVVWVREEDEGFDRPAGMGVRFLSLDPDSRKLIDRMVKERLDREAASMPVVDPDRPWGEEPPLEPEAGEAWDEAPPEPTAEALPSLWADAPERESAIPSGTSSPYAYARSYRGSGVARRDRRSRPLLVVLLAIALLVAVLAAFFLFFPEAAVRLLVGGEAGDGEQVVEVRRPEEAAGAPGGTPVEPVPRSEAEGLLGPEGALEEDAPGEGAAEEERELGFFQSPGEKAAPPPAPIPEPAPAPAPQEPQPTPAPAPPREAASAFSRVLNIVWEDVGDEVLVTVHLDGAIEEWDYSTVRVQVPPPRELVRIEGIARPFARTSIPVDTDLLERIRVGFHPEARRSQLHVVLDLATPDAELDRTEATGTELRLYLARRDD